MRTAIFTIDRAGISVRADLAETVSNHLGNEKIVQVEDSRKPPGRQLRYTIQWTGGAGHVFDGHGRPLGVFADVDALVEHAEAATAWALNDACLPARVRAEGAPDALNPATVMVPVIDGDNSSAIALYERVGFPWRRSTARKPNRWSVPGCDLYGDHHWWDVGFPRAQGVTRCRVSCSDSNCGHGADLMLDTLGLSDDTPFPSIVAEQVARRGFCDMTVGEIVGRAGCCATDVRNALRQAVRLGLVHVEARRVAYDRNRPSGRRGCVYTCGGEGANRDAHATGI